MKHVIFLILSILTVLPVSAQVTVSGHVLDDEDKPLASVIIKCLGMRHKMRGFATSGNDGAFTIKADDGDSLNFSMLGFREQQIAVKNGMKPLTIKMHSGAIELKEVAVKSDKVHERGDTISYIVGAFANANDRSIGDVIAKMPGFEVDNTSGKITYEGKPISKFYIEGLDMLGGKYGVATNTLPQREVGSVEVMRKHQPIRVLEDFTFTNDAAVNIKMKDGAKSHWVTSVEMGGGYGDNASSYGNGDKELCKFEGFALRLKSKLQTMLTYKTNNTGLDISRESTNLYNFDESSMLQPKDFIMLSSPASSAIGREHSLFNRSHAATINVLNKISDDTQLNFQLVYNNERAKAWGQRSTTYIKANGNRVISNNKSWNENNNNLYTLLKYEHNATKSYLRNSLSADAEWLSERLYETGTNPHRQHAYVPMFNFKDNMYIIRRIGKTLVSFYSNNSIQNRPQYLDVDSMIQQNLTQRLYSTDTYGMGGVKLGIFDLSVEFGVKGLLRHLDASANGLPDSLGVLAENSRFGYIQLYTKPKIEFQTNGLTFTFYTPIGNTYYKDSSDDGKDRFTVSPSANIKWDTTSRLSMSVNGEYNVSPVDFNHFYESLIMQDYMTLNQGFKGYNVATDKTLRYSISYRNALKGTHFAASTARILSDTPYTMAQKSIGKYIVWGYSPKATKSDSWQSTLFFQQGMCWLNGKLSLRGIYSHNNTKMIQDEEMVNAQYNMFNTTGSLLLSPYKDMTISYMLRYSYSDMKSEYSNRTSYCNWLHEISVAVPFMRFRLALEGDYYHNKTATDKYKDIFMGNGSLAYKMKHVDLELKASNILNKKTYAYSTMANMVTMQSLTVLRGREIMLTLAYKP